jgi:uncharacterized repeat protein (TIGR01451 family)
MEGASPREQIIEVLKKHPEGLTITTISEATKLHRHTVTKYVYELRGADIIYEREIGPAKLCYIKDGLTNKKERETINRLSNHKMKSNLGQMQLVAIVLFLTLVPAAIITAQNATNITGNISASIEGYMTALNESTSNLSGDLLGELLSESGNEMNGTTNQTEPENGTELPSASKDAFGLNGTYENNEINITIGNETVIIANDSRLNETIENSVPEIQTVNETQIGPQVIMINESVNETEQEADNETQVMEAGIISPEKVNREETFEIKVYAKNTGPAPVKDVKIELVMPEGFTVVSGSNSYYCHEIGPQDYCWNNTTAKAAISSNLGTGHIKATVNYG